MLTSLADAMPMSSSRAVVLVLTTVYISLLYGLYVPDWEYRIPTESPSLSQERILVNFSTHCSIFSLIDHIDMIYD